VRDAAGVAVRFAGSIVDISDRKQVEERLRESESHFRHLVETANDLVWAVDREGQWTYLSPRATRQIFGWEPEDMVGLRLVDSQPERERERTAAMLTRVLNDGTASHFETGHRNRKGEEVVLSLNATALRGANGAIVGVTGTATDITELKAKEREVSAALAEQQLIFDSVSEGIALVKNRTLQKCNSKLAEMFGYRPAEIHGQPTVLFYADPMDWDHLGRQARAAMAQGRIHESELLARRKDGSTFWCDLRGKAIDSAAPDSGSIWVVLDISARKEREQRIQHLADHDALTGLLNRRLLEDRLQQSLVLARRNDALVSVMLIDLDGFKAVNDQFGHLMGDYVLRTVAKRLRECVRESDTVARLGGDEFVVLLSGQRAPEDASLVAEKVLAALTDPVAAGGRRFEIGASIGISIYPRDGTTPEALIRHADAAMYRVKDAGRNRYQFYSS
jgi:diguanylate cyclase (GGDEF)-like protein/PAS domain S-box-containing protein